MNIIFEQSPWFIVPAILAGFVYALLLYFRNKRHPFGPTLTIILGTFRFLLVGLIALLLLHPFLMLKKKIIESPVIILAHDNSASMTLGPDSNLLMQQLPQRFDSLKNMLEKQYQVDAYTFDGAFRKYSALDFTGQQTDISKVFTNIQSAYFNRNVGAVILISDGISNRGIPPDLMPHTQKFPVYTIGMGDTIVRPDIRITDLRHNKIIFKESSFPVELSINARKALGQTIQISIFLDNEKVDEASVLITSEAYTYTHTFHLEAVKPGRSKIKILVSGIENEYILENNSIESFIEIRNEQLDILILARAPHPDIAAIRSALGDQHNVSFELINNWNPENKNYGLVILHELPALNSNNQTLESFMETNTTQPLWVIIGANTDLNSLNRIQNTIQFRPNGSGTLDVLPLAESNFTLFSLEKYHFSRLSRFPALNSPLLEINLPLNHNSLLYQRIRSVATNYPLFGFSEDQNRRFAYITGTGLWRWRMADFNQNGNHETFTETVSKTVNYLMVKNDNRRLRLFTEPSYLINEEIRFRAELYNPALELVNDPDVSLQLVNTESNATFEYQFSRTDNAYQLNAGRLPSGAYNFKANTILGNENLTYEGEFIVATVSVETQEILADHNSLRRIASQSGGRFIPSEDWDKLPMLLQGDVQIATTATYSQTYHPLIWLIWLPLLILLLATLEWLLRKINGSY